ncbi:MAG TPA: response regulator [Rhizomicrobium sp.]|nr:response regulator [Rhizomicrobium sp.]
MPANRSLVWVVDDVESVRKSIAAALETAGVTVCAYPSAAEFLADFKPGTTGCLIIDHQMPGMTGLELLKQLKTGQGSPPTIVISAHGNQALKDRIMAAGAVAMLDKPVDADELLTLVERALVDVP